MSIHYQKGQYFEDDGRGNLTPITQDEANAKTGFNNVSPVEASVTKMPEGNYIIETPDGKTINHIPEEGL